ncbi:hypothetical protein L4C34_15540 [Vibrio profundum]|uniref:type VI secretion protein IcmF/TssM N-terminal domain-containing protein n=1 Tax=Vibrio profundum TaxID=2910247 RepID=UPI003D09E4E2
MSGSKRKWLWAALKLCAFLIVVVAISAAIFLWVDLEHWPWWAGAVVASAVIAIGCFVYLARRYVLRYKERRFVEHVVKHDKDAIEASQWALRQRCYDLEQRWTQALQQLKSSRLKRQGHPLYVLPWYLVLGEESTGKSSLLRQCGSSSVLTPLSGTSGSATKHCDWWFFEQGVFLDSSGKYVTENTANDDYEWQHLLALMAKARRREPLNGLIVTLSVEQLVPPNFIELQQYGRQLRRKIDHLSKVLGAEIPVYLMITKCDQLEGFMDFANLLEADKRDMLLGGINQDRHNLPIQVVAEGIEQVRAQLLAYQMEHLAGTEPLPRCVLLLSQNIANLQGALTQFAESAFGQTPYQEPIFLRALSFNSAEHTDPVPVKSYSKVLNAPVTPNFSYNSALTSVEGSGNFLAEKVGNASAPLNVLPAVEKQHKAETQTTGMFLRQFFSDRLQQDRHLYRFSGSFLRWRMWSSNVSMIAGLLLLFFAVGGMSIDFIQTHDSFQNLSVSMSRVNSLSSFIGNTQPPSLQDKQLALSELARTIRQAEHSHQVLAEVGLNLWLEKGIVRAKKAYVVGYSKWMWSDLHLEFDQPLNANIAHTPQQVGNTVDYLTWQIAQLKSRINDGHSTPVRIAPLGSHTAKESFNTLAFVRRIESQQRFIDYIDWSKSDAQLNQTLRESQQHLQYTLSQNPLNGWLSTWVQDNDQIANVDAADFWQASLSGHPVSVPGAYTLAGKRFVDSFLVRLESCGQGKVTKQILRFQQDYHHQFISHWFDFYRGFPESAKGLSLADRVQIANQLLTENNPFSRMRTRVLTELRGLGGTSRNWQSLWLAQEVEQQYWSENTNKSLLSKGSELLHRNDAQLVSDDPAFQSKLDHGVKLLGAYYDPLNKMLAHIGDTSTAYQAVKPLFVQSTLDSAENKTAEVAHKLSQLMHVTGSHANGGNIYNAQFLFILNTEEALAAQYLQDLWSEQVYGPLQYIPAHDRRQKLFSDNGLLSAFVKGPAKGLIKMGAVGWAPGNYMGTKLPFTKEFLSFIDQGEYLKHDMKSDYKVVVKALPMGVNTRAQNHPYQSTLTLACSNKQQQLVNYNYSQSQLFDWQPAMCGDTTLTVSFNGFDLQKVYPGTNGFQHFLTQFKHGVVTFSAKDFPSSEQILHANNIRWLKIQYQFSGNSPIVALHTRDRTRLPLKIVDI